MPNCDRKRNFRTTNTRVVLDAVLASDDDGSDESDLSNISDSSDCSSDNETQLEDNTQADDTQSDDDVTASADSCLLYTSPSPRDRQKSRMPSSA